MAAASPHPAARVPPLPADATAAGDMTLTVFTNESSGMRQTVLPVPKRPRDVKAVASLLTKLQIVSVGRNARMSFGDAVATALGEGDSAFPSLYRVEFSPPAPAGSDSDSAVLSDAAVADTVWFMGGVQHLVVFCANKSDAGNGRSLDEIDDSSPVLVWMPLMTSVPRARRAISRLWACCRHHSARADGDAFDDLGSDFEEYLRDAREGIPHSEREAMVAGIRAAYCAAHGLPKAAAGGFPSLSGATGSTAER